MSAPDRRALVDCSDALSIRKQCVLLGVARSGLYRPPRPANDDDLALMRRIDELFTAWPVFGSRGGAGGSRRLRPGGHLGAQTRNRLGTSSGAVCRLAVLEPCP